MNIEIADRLAKLRKEKGYSQEQLADALGISRQAVSKWERAEASPDTDNLICLAKLYGVSLDTLLKTEQPAEEIAADKKEETAEEEKEEDSQDDEDEDGKKDDKLTKGEIIYAEQVLHLKKKKALSKFLDGGIVLLTIVAYCVAAGLTGLWHPLWIIFFPSLAFITLVDCFIRKYWDWGGYPLLITGIYLFLGFQYNLWHPYWFLFITIPLFYAFASFMDYLTKQGKYNKDHKIIEKYMNRFENDKQDD